MTITVRLFASYAERLGRPALAIELPEGSTVGDVITSVSALPGGSALPATPVVAVNSVYASNRSPLADGDEVALIPPVAGG